MLEQIFIPIYFAALGIQIFEYIFFYRCLFYKTRKENEPAFSEPVSVIICAKDEYKNLKLFLPKFLNQSYNQFEIIVVNDNSVDLTKNFLNEQAKLYKHLKVIHLEEDTGSKGKKYAVTKGIEAAENDCLLFSDADCFPVSENWIKEMARSYTEQTDIVLGYGAYQNEKGLLNKYIRFDTQTIALKYLSLAKAGIPYMGVGRNLSYRKKAFIKNKGFENHRHIISGDDDLFVNEAARMHNTKINFNADSITVSVPKKTLKEFLHQKSRHLTSGNNYKSVHKIILATDVFTLLILYISLIFALNEANYPYLILSYIIKLILQIIIYNIFTRHLNEKKNLIFIPIFDVLIPVVNIFISFRNMFFKKIVWK